MATKLELAALRIQLIDRLGTTKEPSELVAIQAELTEVNRQLKALNVAEAQRLKERATAKAVRGQVQSDEDLARAERKLDLRTRQETGGNATLGEMIIVRAKQLAKLLDSVPSASSLPHTDLFVPQLEAFILQQKQHLKVVASTHAPGTSNKPTDWKDTWKDENALSDGKR